MALKRSGLNQSTAANIREELESRNRGAHTHAARRGGFNATESQRAGREREESGSDCDTEPRRDLRTEKKQRERSRSNEESQIAPHFFLFTCVRDTVPIIRCLFAPLHHPPPWCQKYYCYRGNWCVQGVRLRRCKRTNSPSGLFITPIFSCAHIHVRAPSVRRVTEENGSRSRQARARQHRPNTDSSSL